MKVNVTEETFYAKSLSQTYSHISGNVRQAKDYHEVLS